MPRTKTVWRITTSSWAAESTFGYTQNAEYARSVYALLSLPAEELGDELLSYGIPAKPYGLEDKLCRE